MATQVWLLEFEIARVRKHADECMKNVATTQYVEHNRKGHHGNKSENRKGTSNGGDAVS
jgi:hypothetical protein